MLLGSNLEESRKKRTAAAPDPDVQPVADADQPHIAKSAGTTPAGAIGGGEVLQTARNMQEGGSPSPTVVTDSMRDVGTVPADIVSTGGSVGHSVGQENPAMEPGASGGGDPSDIDALAEQFVRDQLEAAARGGDTAEQEALIRQQAEAALGAGLVDSRARAGRAGFATSGMQAALEQDARTRSQRQVGLDIIDARIAENQRVIDNAMAAGRYDLAAQAQANQDALTQAKIDAFNALVEGMGGEVTGAPDGGEDGPVGAAIGAAQQALADETTPFGKGTGQTELAAAADEYPIAMNGPDEGDEKVGTVTDAQGQSWDIYEKPNGTRYKVGSGG
jgi:hypothetical protein